MAHGPPKLRETPPLQHRTATSGSGVFTGCLQPERASPTKPRWQQITDAPLAA